MMGRNKYISATGLDLAYQIFASVAANKKGYYCAALPQRVVAQLAWATASPSESLLGTPLECLIRVTATVNLSRMDGR
jgi:hypothetical protein